jgi:hypothetical protein
MNEEYWQLRAASRNYFDSHQITTRLSNRMKALARAGHVEPVLNLQLSLAEDARKQIGKELTHLYRQLAPPKITAFQAATPGLGELYTAQLVGCVGDFISYTEAWWEEAPGDGSQADPDSHRGNASSQAMHDSHSTRAGSQSGSDSPTGPDDEDEDELLSQAPGDSQRRNEKRTLVTGATIRCGVRDIWSYCGHGDASRKRRKGMTQQEAFAAGSPLAKSIVHMMADFSVRLNGVPDKNGRARAKSPYYDNFITWKEQAAELHPDDWTKLRVHNHAIRKTGKAILKDLWRVQHDFPPAYGDRTPWTPREEQPITA